MRVCMSEIAQSDGDMSPPDVEMNLAMEIPDLKGFLREKKGANFRDFDRASVQSFQ